MKNLYKLMLSTACGAILLPLNQLHASEARIDTLGASLILSDVTNVYTLPSLLPYYSEAIIELGTANNDHAYAGILKKNGSNSFGVLISRDDALFTNSSLAISLSDQWLDRSASNSDSRALTPTPDTPLEMFYARSLGNGQMFGTKLTFARYKHTEENRVADTKEKKEAQQLDLSLGYTTKETNQFDIALNIGLVGKLDNGTPEEKYTFTRKNDITLTTRYAMPNGNSSTGIVAMFGMRAPTVSVKNGTVDEDSKFNETVFYLEGGYNHVPVPETLLHVSAGALYCKSSGPVINSGTGVGTSTDAAPSILTSDKNATVTTTAILLAAGLETALAWDMGALAGINYTIWGDSKVQNEINETEFSTSMGSGVEENLWSLGLFYKKDKLRVDATFQKEFLHNGPHFVTGDATNNILGRISASYQI